MQGIAQPRDGIDLLAQADAPVSDDELGDVLGEVHRLKTRLCAQEARLTAVYDTRKAFQPVDALAGKIDPALCTGQRQHL